MDLARVKLSASCLVLSMLLSFGTGCAPQTESLDKSAKKAGDTLVMGFECGFVPYGFLDKDSGEYVGFDIDLAKELTKRRGWTLVLKPIDWRFKEAMINSGELDCLWNGFKMKGREQLYEWSKPYTVSQQVVIVREGKMLSSLDDLAGKVVAVQSTTPNYDLLLNGALKEIGGKIKRIIPVNDFVLLIRELDENPECDAIISDSIAASYYQKQKGGKFHLTNVSLMRTPDGIAFKRGNVALRDQIQETLDEMAADGTFALITIKWFGQNISNMTSGNAK